MKIRVSYTISLSEVNSIRQLVCALEAVDTAAQNRYERLAGVTVQADVAGEFSTLSFRYETQTEEPK